MPLISSILMTVFAAISKLSSNSTHAYLPIVMPGMNNDSYPHPVSMILSSMPDTINSTTHFEANSDQLSTLIDDYHLSRTVLFDGYTKFQNNATIARYNVREVCFSLLATIERAQKCALYFEKIITDQTLTKPEIAKLQKRFDAFTAQCRQDCISYKIPPHQEVFYADQLDPPANIGNIVKVLHLLQYVVNGYAKMISSETGIYDTNVIIDYSGGGGLTLQTGVIRVDINMFQDLIEFLRMYAHENGHLRTVIYHHQSTRTIPSDQLPYITPELLSEQPAFKENEAEADLNAAIVCALYNVPLSRSYTKFKSEIPLPPSQEALDPHPEGTERAKIMQNAVSSLSYHFGDNHFGTNNIWQQFAQRVRSISGINFSRDIPTMAELLRIYNLSPHDKAKQIHTLKTEYPHLFTSTTRGDYPNAPLVAVGIDKQLGAIFNWSLPFQQNRLNTPTETIEDFQAQWKLANGHVPFPDLVTPPPPSPKLFAYEQYTNRQEEQIEADAPSAKRTTRVRTRLIQNPTFPG